MKWWDGREMKWDPDQRQAEEDRQRWVMREIGTMNELIRELTVDPRREYEIHRDAYLETGDLMQLRMALEYVQ